MAENSVPTRSGRSSQSGPGYETQDFSLGSILWFGLGLAVLIGVSLFVVWVMVGVLSTAEPVAEPEPVPPGPRLQVLPADELTELRAAEEKILNSYGWVDPETETVRLPIDRAMELLLEQGLPARSPQDNDK